MIDETIFKIARLLDWTYHKTVEACQDICAQYPVPSSVILPCIESNLSLQVGTGEKPDLEKTKDTLWKSWHSTFEAEQEGEALNEQAKT